MANPAGRILTVNGGSSSIKFAAFEPGPRPRVLFSGQIERIGKKDATLRAKSADGELIGEMRVVAPSHAEAAGVLVDWLGGHLSGMPISAVGHRVVHGGVGLLEHQVVTDGVLEELRRAQGLDLAHLPREIALIEAMSCRLPGVPQVACFDTAFHREMPRVAQLMPVPLEYYRGGVRRFGFHGLSYTYLMEELRRQGGSDAAGGKVILAHLGSGASMAAVKGGRPVDTTMAFTPTAGMVMGTRPGDLDPGLLLYLMRTEGMTPEAAEEFISHRCGLLGLSETSSDVRDLQKRRGEDARAAEALEVFYHSARKWVAALAASLGGLDTLVFSGGIGEHSVEARAAICGGLGFLGVRLDGGKNSASAPVISEEGSEVTVRVTPTNEEIVIAEIVGRVLGGEVRP